MRWSERPASDFLSGALRTAVQPFRYRSRVGELLGQPGTGDAGLHAHAAPPPGPFHYLEPLAFDPTAGFGWDRRGPAPSAPTAERRVPAPADPPRPGVTAAGPELPAASPSRPGADPGGLVDEPPRRIWDVSTPPDRPHRPRRAAPGSDSDDGAGPTPAPSHRERLTEPGDMLLEFGPPSSAVEADPARPAGADPDPADPGPRAPDPAGPESRRQVELRLDGSESPPVSIAARRAPSGGLDEVGVAPGPDVPDVAVVEGAARPDLGLADSSARAAVADDARQPGSVPFGAASPGVAGPRPSEAQSSEAPQPSTQAVSPIAARGPDRPAMPGLHPPGAAEATPGERPGEPARQRVAPDRAEPGTVHPRLPPPPPTRVVSITTAVPETSGYRARLRLGRLGLRGLR